MAAATIRDVAREAGVSPATVSRAFNEQPTVGPEYVAKVKKAAAKLGYRPNVVARNLRKKTSDVIALIIPDVGNSFHTAIARGVEDAAQEAGYSVLLGNSDENAEKEQRYLDVSQMQQVAGVLICPHDPDLDISELLEQDVPVVAMDRRMSAPVDTVMSSSVKGAYDATKHLAEQGWERIACLTGPNDVDTARLRMTGYLDAMRDLGLEPTVVHASYDIPGGQDGVRRALELRPRPDAIFVANEPLALGAVAQLRREGVSLGEDLGFVCFDDSLWTQILSPPLTVVRQQSYEIGAQAARLLVERLTTETKIPPRHVEFSTDLVVRESSLRSARGSKSAG